VPSYLYSLYLDSWNPSSFPYYIRDYYLKHNDPDKSINIHYMVIDPEKIMSDTSQDLDKDKIFILYQNHKINIYVVSISILSQKNNINNINNIYSSTSIKEEKIILVIIFFDKNDENKIKKELVMKRKINDFITIQIMNKNIYKLKIKEYNDIIDSIVNENQNDNNKYLWHLKLFDIIIALWILIVSFLFKYLIKLGKKKTKKKYEINNININNSNNNNKIEYFFVNKKTKDNFI